MRNLDIQLNNLKEYSNEINLKNLTKRIYELNFNNSYLKSLSQNQLQYIHVKLHTALSYRKSFAPISKLKELHDKIVVLLVTHTSNDLLDVSSKRLNS